MTTKHSRAIRVTNALGQRRLDPQYVGFFQCFNRQQFFEAHEVLEPLWLAHRRQPDGAFYKGLIQLAGAFVHVKKGRQQPALALLRLAQTNLEAYPALHHHLELPPVLQLIRDWRGKLEAIEPGGTDLTIGAAPTLQLQER